MATPSTYTEATDPQTSSQRLQELASIDERHRLAALANPNLSWTWLWQECVDGDLASATVSASRLPLLLRLFDVFGVPRSPLARRIASVIGEP